MKILLQVLTEIPILSLRLWLIIIIPIIVVLFAIRSQQNKKREPKNKDAMRKEEERKIDIPITCPHCKNPNMKKLKTCEWCGLSFAKTTDNNKLPENDLDAELIKRLERQSIDSVVEFYQKTTGKSRRESYYYVCRLNFFRIHKFANEAAWEAEQKRVNKFYKKKDIWLLILAIFFIIICSLLGVIGGVFLRDIIIFGHLIFMGLLFLIIYLYRLYNNKKHLL